MNFYEFMRKQGFSSIQVEIARSLGYLKLGLDVWHLNVKQVKDNVRMLALYPEPDAWYDPNVSSELNYETKQFEVLIPDKLRAAYYEKEDVLLVSLICQ